MSKYIGFSREYQRKAKAYNLPGSLLEPAHNHLIALYLQIEALSLKSGFCSASDITLSKYLKVNKTTVVRQRVKLIDLGLIIQKGGVIKGKARQLYLWHQVAAILQEKNNQAALSKLLAHALRKPHQVELEAMPEINTADFAPDFHGPTDDFYRQYIAGKYPVTNFFELPHTEQETWRDKWRLESPADLVWLFAQEMTPLAYKIYKGLAPGIRAKIAAHAPFYVYSNRDNPDMVMNLIKYISPATAGYKTRIRNRKPATGQTRYSKPQVEKMKNHQAATQNVFDNLL